MESSAEDPRPEDPQRTDIRGSNQSGMRAYNERLVLTLLRRHGPLAKAQIARLTGLSAQTVSVIMRALESDALISRGEPRRGRVGQPSIPMHLEPTGAYFLGLKVGRRSVELVLIDFMGKVLDRARHTHAFPTPDATLDFVREALPDLLERAPPQVRERVAGLGVGLPFHLWSWADPLGVPPENLAAWREIDLEARLAAEVPFPVLLENDGSAACSAEIVFGTRGPETETGDFIYAYVGYFAGGGLVLDGRLVSGKSRNAGALGSMPVPAPGGGSVQLLSLASLSGLEAMLAARGHDAAGMWESPEDWRIDDDVLSAWVREAAAGFAHVAASSAALLDLEALVIDGWLPAELRARLVAETSRALARIDLSGVSVPHVREGTVGPGARSVGAASLPLSTRFLIDPNALTLPH